MNILILNSGSSSLKFLLGEFPLAGRTTLPRNRKGGVRGLVERIGGTATLTLASGEGPAVSEERQVPGHPEAVRWVLERVAHDGVEAMGHRVVHGGAWFRDPVVIDDDVMAKIERVIELAPLHNPAGLATIRAAREAIGDALPMVAVFDTAFHRTMPEHAATYAIDEELAASHGIRRYGFHGIAHASAIAAYADSAGRSLDGTRLITLHLGNGCSAAAIRDGCSVDTSMGFTPLEGLVMGTRSGDCDPGLIGYLARHVGWSIDQIDRLLNERSGLLGLSGRSSDMREVLSAAAEHDRRAELALAVFCYRARKYLGAYLAVLGGADAVVFSGGIGERAPDIRARICDGMDWCGLRLDPDRNRDTTTAPAGSARCISAAASSLPVYVAGIDEETWIARETLRCLRGKEGASR